MKLKSIKRDYILALDNYSLFYFKDSCDEAIKRFKKDGSISEETLKELYYDVKYTAKTYAIVLHRDFDEDMQLFRADFKKLLKSLGLKENGV